MQAVQFFTSVHQIIFGWLSCSISTIPAVLSSCLSQSSEGRNVAITFLHWLYRRQKNDCADAKAFLFLNVNIQLLGMYFITIPGKNFSCICNFKIKQNF